MVQLKIIQGTQYGGDCQGKSPRKNLASLSPLCSWSCQPNRTGPSPLGSTWEDLVLPWANSFVQRLCAGLQLGAGSPVLGAQRPRNTLPRYVGEALLEAGGISWESRRSSVTTADRARKDAAGDCTETFLVASLALPVSLHSGPQPC